MNFSKQDNWEDVPNYVMQNIVWTKVANNDQHIIYKSYNVNGIIINIRINNFPDEPLYTLIEEEKDIIHFNDWPKNWTILA